MNGQEKRMKTYCAQVERRLALPREVKARVMTDFTTTITALRESGRSDAEIIARLGTPKQAAAELNEQMKEFAYRKSPWRFAGLAASLISGLLLAFYSWIQTIGALSSSSFGNCIAVIGGADGSTAIFVTQTAGIDWDLVILGAAMVLGILLYWCLSRCKPKK